MQQTIKPAFYAMSFEDIGNWVSRNNTINGESVFDDDFSEIEEMHAAGHEAEAFNEYEAIAEEIWASIKEAI